MIKGTGSLQVSDRTVAVAMQEYLDKRLAEGMSVNVTAVRAIVTDTSQVFEVSIAEKEVSQP